MSKGDNSNTVSKHHFIHLQKVLNVVTTNCDIFSVSLECHAELQDDSICFLYSCYKILLSSRESRTQGFHVPEEMKKTNRVGQVSEGARQLGLHVRSIC